MIKKRIVSLSLIALICMSFLSGNNTPVNAAVETETYVMSMKLGKIRNDFTGFVGMKITIGSEALKVTSLGRIYFQGSTESHTVKIVDAATGTDVSGASAAIKGGTKDGTFTYADLSAPVVLESKKAYYIVTEETAGKDKWCDFDTRIIHTSAAVCNNLIFKLDGKWVGDSAQSSPFGPVDFKYEKIKSTGTQTPATGESTAFVRLSQLGKLRNDYSGWVGMRITVGSDPITVTSLARIFVKDNKLIHTVKLVDATTGDDVSGAGVFLSGGTNGKFTYMDLAKPVVLQAKKSYYLVSDETKDSDLWYDGDSRVITNNVATADGIVYFSMEEKTFCKWVFIEAAGASFVPVDFKYVKTENASSSSVSSSSKISSQDAKSGSTSAITDSKAESGSISGSNATASGSLWTIIIIASAAVLVTAGIVLFLLLRKKSLSKK